MAVPVPLARSVVPVTLNKTGTASGGPFSWDGNNGTALKSGTCKFGKANTAVAQEAYAMLMVGANTLVYNPGGAGVEDCFIKFEINGANSGTGWHCMKEIISTTASGSDETFLINLQTGDLSTAGKANKRELDTGRERAFDKFNFDIYLVDSAGDNVPFGTDPVGDNMSGSVLLSAVMMGGALRYKPAVIPEALNATVLIGGLILNPSGE
tara:strand:+ start:72 stop:701 length:630 start_codon:yes stop_codon:yes gene_type:complete